MADFTINPTGSLSISNNGADVRVSDQLVLREGSQFNVAAGTTIHMTGADFVVENTDSETLNGLVNLGLVFEGGAGVVDALEAVGEDHGLTYRTYLDNLTLGAIQLGGTAGIGQVQLVDAHDNQPDFEGSKAIYVSSLVVGSGSQLDLNGLNLYYFDGSVLGTTINTAGGNLVQLNHWNLTGGGAYQVGSNWAAGTVPNAPGAEANFLDQITAPATITVDSPVTLGAITFDSARGYGITGSGTVTMQAASGDARIDVWTGHHSIAAPLSLASDLTVWTQGTSSLAVNLRRPCGVLPDLTKQGAGTWTVSGGLALLGGVDVQEGTMQIGTDLLALAAEMSAWPLMRR